MARFRVVFIDKGNCEICEVEVECYRITNAPKLAAKMLTEEQEKIVQGECKDMQVLTL